MIKTTMQGIKGNQKENRVERLTDTSSTGRVRPWREYKMANELLAMVYDSINPKKAGRLRDCADWLGFRIDEEGRKKLVEANFCHVRLCPMCQWRRSIKSYKYTSRIVSSMIAHYREAEDINLRWLMVTLTVRNCTGPQLSNTLDQMQEGWKRLCKLKTMEPVIGWYRALEVVHDCNEYITEGMYTNPKRNAYYAKHGLKVGDRNPSYDMYHPHYHVLIAVTDTYARISYEKVRETWRDAWQSAARLSYVPQVDVRRSYRQGKESNADDVAAMVAEAAKYTCKPGDYLKPDDWDLTVDTVELLDKALDGRRFAAYGKACRDWHKKLNLDDVDSDNADLVGAEEDGIDKLEPTIIYAWATGYKQYIAER